VQQDKLLTAVAVLNDRDQRQAAAISNLQNPDLKEGSNTVHKKLTGGTGQERAKDRPVSRMDSGYYDGQRDSESEDLASDIGTGSTVSSDSLDLLTSVTLRNKKNFTRPEADCLSTGSPVMEQMSSTEDVSSCTSTVTDEMTTSEDNASDSVDSLLSCLCLDEKLRLSPPEAPRVLRSPLLGSASSQLSSNRSAAAVTAVTVGDSSLSLAEPTILLDSSF
jgi:hypothetical protein